MKKIPIFFIFFLVLSLNIYPQYCQVSLQNPSMGFIRIFNFNGILNANNTYDPSGYSDYSATYRTDLCYPGQTYSFQVDGSGFWANNSGVTIWIDFNQNGNFNEPNEKVFRSVVPSSMVISGSITIPTNALEGSTRIRVLYSDYWPYFSQYLADNPCCYNCLNGMYGEYEDYRIRIASFQPTIISSTNDTILCTDSFLKVSYTISGTFNSANVFSVQLSDSLGSFTNHTTIGSLTSQISDSIICYIPKFNPPGTRYKVRIVSSDPVVIGTPNNSNIVINKLPNPSILGNSNVCDRSYYSYQTLTASNRLWTWSSEKGVVYQSQTSPNKAIIYWGDLAPEDVPVYDTLKVIELNTITGCKDSNLFQVTIYPKPHLEILGKNSVCELEEVVYSVTNTNLSSYKWIANRGSIIGSDNTNTVIVKWGSTASTNGSVKLIGVNQNGCKDTTEILVTINNLPSPKITGDLICCEKTPQIYASNSKADETDQWLVINGTIIGESTTKAVIIEWSQKGTGQVALIQKNSITGCSDTARSVINILPRPSASINGGLTVCSSEWSYYTTESQPGYIYDWNIIGGKVSGPIDNAGVFIEWKSTSGRGVLRLIKENSQGCRDTSSINIDINEKPKASIDGPTMSKVNSVVSYETTQDDKINYKWEVLKGGKILGSTTESKVDIKWEFGPEGKLQLIQQDRAFGCSDTALLTNSITNSNVIINGYSEVCENSEWIYTSDLPLGAENKWSAFGGSIVGSSLGKSVVVRWSNKGNGIINLIQTIQKDNFKDSSSMYVNINPVPEKPKITRQNNQLSSSAFLSNQWYLDGVKLLDSTDQFLYPSKNGNYQVSSYQKPCTSELSLAVYVNLLGVEDQESYSELKIIPNPANSEFKIISLNDLITAVKIFNILGESIFSEENLTSSVFNVKSINLQSGVFYIMISTEKQYIVKKILIYH